MKRLAGMALAAAVAALPATAQCAMCQTALSSSPEGQAMMGAMSRGILVLLAAPYVLVATCSAILFRHRLAKLLPARWHWRASRRLSCP